MLKTVLLNIFVETMIRYFFQIFFYQYKVQKNSIDLKYKYLMHFNIIINVFNATFNQFSLAQ